MAFRKKKISQMDPKGAPLASTDLLEISELVSGSYVTKSITGAEIISSAPAASWGTITGTLSTQTDLQNALNAKVTGNTAITGATKTKVTYDSKGLVTSGADATTADIADSLNKRYVTDANLTTIGNQSGVNTGDQTLAGLGGVPTTRTLTINGTTQDLSADRTFTVATGITIGTTAITSGVVGRVLFEGAGNVVQESANLFWDNMNARLSVGTSTQAYTLAVGGKLRVTSGSYWVDSGATALQVDGTSSFSDNVTLLGTKAILFGTSATQIGGGASGPLTFRAGSGSTQMSLFSTGNFAINTTTDAGFKVDINGTARVQGVLTTTAAINSGGSVTIPSGTNFVISGATNALSAPTFAIWGGGTNVVNISNGGYGMLSRLNFGQNGITSTPSLAMNANELIVRDGNNGVATSFGVGVSSTMNASAKMQIDSTTQGFLPPRMTTTQKNAIATPSAGLMVYDTTLNLISVWNGTTWITL